MSDIKHRHDWFVNEYENYHDFCLACEDDNIFSEFRNSAIYKGILEHCPAYHGQRYLEVIELHKEIYSKKSTFQRNDLIGNPTTYLYDVTEDCDRNERQPIIDPSLRRKPKSTKLRKILSSCPQPKSDFMVFSPTTLRYVKVACDLDKFLGDLSGFKVCEIGGGYGGQFLILDALYKDLDYHAVDLKGSLAVSKKYLDNYELSSNITYVEPQNLESSQYDLIISNYSFSELTLDIQNFYTDKILSSSTNGYITYNEYSDNFTLNDYETKFKAEIIEDYPSECCPPNNKIIFWGSSDVDNKWHRYWHTDNE